MSMYQESTKILQANKLFNNIEVELENSSVKGNLVSFNDGEFIFSEGDSSDSIFLIVKGEVKIVKKEEQGSGEIISVTEDEFFGFYEMNNSSNRTSSAVAISDTYIIEISFDELASLVNLYNGISDNLKASPLMNGDELNAELFAASDEADAPADIFADDDQEMPGDENDNSTNEIAEETEEEALEEEVTNIDLTEDSDETTIQPEEELSDEVGEPQQEDSEENDNAEPDEVVAETEDFDEETKDELEKLPEDTIAIENDDIFEEAPEDLPEPDEESGEPETPEEVIKIVPEVRSVYCDRLTNAIKEIVAITNAGDLSKTFLNKCVDMCNAESGVIYLFNEVSGLYKPFVATDSIYDHQFIKPGEGVAGWTVEKRKPLMVNDVEMDERLREEYDDFETEKSGSMLVHPVVENDEVDLVIKLFNNNNGEFNDTHAEFINVLTSAYRAAQNNLQVSAERMSEMRLGFLKKISAYLQKDIKQPLLVTKRYTEHLREKYIPEDIDKVLKRIADQLTETTDNLNTISEYSTGDFKLRKNAIYLNRYLKDLAKNVEPYLGDRNCTLELETDKQCRIYVDTHKLRIVLKNLFANACNAMENGGTILLKTEVSKEMVSIYISDSGNGIDPDVKEHIFEPFITTDESAKGLGLFLARVILQKHGGDISIVDTGSEGTTVKLSLPLANDI